MRIASLTPLVAVVLLSGCGGSGGDGVKTVVTPTAQPAPSSGTSGASGTSGRAAAPGASGASGPTETAPGAALPTDTKGATAVQGRYSLQVLTSDFPLLTKRKAIIWGATTSCEDSCTVELQRQTEQGGFKRVTLKQDGNSRYGGNGTGTTDRCGADQETGTRDRTSLRVVKQRDEGGVPLATEIEGFVRVTYRCRGIQQKQVLRVRGRLEG